LKSFISDLKRAALIVLTWMLVWTFALMLQRSCTAKPTDLRVNSYDISLAAVWKADTQGEGNIKRYREERVARSRPAIDRRTLSGWQELSSL